MDMARPLLMKAVLLEELAVMDPISFNWIEILFNQLICEKAKCLQDNEIVANKFQVYVTQMKYYFYFVP
jgi:hypothetical protein